MRRKSFTLIFLHCLVVNYASATAPPQAGHPAPQGYYDRLAADPNAFEFGHAYLSLTQTARRNREAVKNFAMPMGVVQKVAGTRRIIVLLMQYSDTNTTPYAPAALAQELFGNQGTSLSSYYRENSYGNLEVKGDVKPWVRLMKKESEYAGPDVNCHATCGNSNVASMVEEAVRLNDAQTQWGTYDNDSIENKPNISSNRANHDDGFVDFVAIVHPGRGAECDTPSSPSAPTSLWSHHSKLSSWPNHSAIDTSSVNYNGKGGRIKVDDYVLFPAVACDGITPIPIGVIAHEIGHALGLPDLYDTSRDATSEGVGNWDLMAGGAWGGDGQSPESPVHMSAWSKGYLGWLIPTDITTDRTHLALKPFETKGEVFLITIKNDAAAGVNDYYLLSNRQRIGFDAKLPGVGLLILRVRESTLKTGLAHNTVNVDPNKMGVSVVEADGLNQLVHQPSVKEFRGGPDDTFPGGKAKNSFDNNTTPGTPITLALCSIQLTNDIASFDVFLSRGSCGAVAQEVPAVSVSALSQNPEKFARNEVRVSGRLTNEVQNYFRDPPNLILSDSEGFQIHVAPWTLMEIPPSRDPKRPLVIAEYLGRSVELTGDIERAQARFPWIFQVHHAQVLR